MPGENVVSMFSPPTHTSHPVTTSGTKQHVSLYIMSPEHPSAQYSGYETLKLTLNGRPTINWLSYSFRIRLLTADCTLPIVHYRLHIASSFKKLPGLKRLATSTWRQHPSESSRGSVRAVPLIH